MSKDNKKFQYSVVKKGSTASKYAGSLQWIEDAGIVSRCYNLSATELPLDGNAQDDIFKVYMRDYGLFISMLEDGTQFDVLQGNLARYKGTIKLGDYNVGKSGEILTLPLCMAFLLTEV